ncbi:MAG: hypothetical protein V1809_05955 [Planctomycetota bacterium]
MIITAVIRKTFTGARRLTRMPGFWRAAGAAGAVLAVLLVVEVAAARVRGLPVFRVDASRITLGGRPAWVGACLEDEIVRALRAEGVVSLADPRLTARVANIFRACPWVKRVSRVGKRFPAELELDVEIRRPAACVRMKTRDILLSEDGVVLPWRHYQPSPGLALPAITGVASAPPAEGKPWTGQDVGDALALLRRLGEEGMIHSYAITGVDVSNFGGRRDGRASEVVLWTRHRGYIKWGAPLAREERFGHLDAVEKIRKLRGLIEEQPRLAEGGWSYIDIRFDDAAILPRS